MIAKTKKLKKSSSTPEYKTSEKVRHYTSIFKAWLSRWAPDRSDESESWAMVSNDQFSMDDKINMAQRGQIPLQLNQIREKIDTQTGMLLENPWVFKFENETNRKNFKSAILNKIVNRDRNTGFWSKVEYDLTYDMLVHQGVVEIFIDKSLDPINGTVNIRRRDPGTVIPSPDWRTSKEKDNEIIFSCQWLSPKQIQSHYRLSGEEIEAAIERREKELESNAPTKPSNRAFDRSPELSDKENGLYLVVEAYYFDRQPGYRLYDRNTGDFLDDLPEEDQALLREHIHMGIVTDLEEIYDDDKEVLKVFSCAPGLSLGLELYDGPHEMQIGEYPFVFISAYNDNGKRSGLVKVYKDPQKSLNKSHSAFLHWQMTAANGIEFATDDMFADGEMKRYQQEKNIPGGLFILNDIEKRPTYKQRDNVPQDFDQEMERMLGFMNTIGPPPNAQGIADSAGESGALFDSRREQANIKSRGYSLELLTMQYKLGKMYLKLVPTVYGDFPFPVLDGEERLIINSSPETSLKDVGQLELMVVNGPIGVSQKRENINIFNTLAHNETDPLIRTWLMSNVIENLPTLTDNKIAEGQKLFKLIIDNSIKQILLQSHMADQQLAAAVMQSQGAMPGLPGAQPGLPPSQGQNAPAATNQFSPGPTGPGALPGASR